jgi:hypothetical protein
MSHHKDGSKHEWAFKENTQRTNVIHGANGMRVSMSIVGLYECQCGLKKFAKARLDQPWPDLRDVMGVMGPKDSPL